jgi:hypothetical protein
MQGMGADQKQRVPWGGEFGFEVAVDDQIAHFYPAAEEKAEHAIGRHDQNIQRNIVVKKILVFSLAGEEHAP